MKALRIANAIGHIDDDLITDAAESKKKEKSHWLKWGSFAACFAVLCIAAAVSLPLLFGGDVINPGGNDDRYKDLYVQAGESAIVWPWEYKTIDEKYVSINIEGKEFTGRKREISESFVGGKIGTYEATGYEDTDEGVYYESFDAYEITGVAADELIAVKMEDRYYVFISEKYDPPATWGEVVEKFALSETIKLGRFSIKGKDVEDHYRLLNSDEYIWSILGSCDDAVSVDPTGWHENRGNYISFTITSEALGVYKRAMYVTENGYVWTNSFDGEFLYHIGEDATGKIIKYAKENSIEVEYEPYRNAIAGEVVEITDEYILIDDSILCKDPADGITYKVLLNDLRISRYVDHGVVEVGDTVQISYEGEIDKSNGNTIAGAISASKAMISDGAVLIPE